MAEVQTAVRRRGEAQHRQTLESIGAHGGERHAQEARRRKAREAGGREEALSSRSADRRRGELERGCRAFARKGSPADRDAAGGRRTAASAPQRAGLCRARRDHRLAAGVRRQRESHFRPARGAHRPARGGAARRGRRSKTCAPAACRRPRSALFARSPRPSPRAGSTSRVWLSSTPKRRMRRSWR